MCKRLLPFDRILSKCESQLHGSDWKVTPSNLRLGFRSIRARGTGKALVDLPLRSISHVFLKFSCTRLTVASLKMHHSVIEKPYLEIPYLARGVDCKAVHLLNILGKTVDYCFSHLFSRYQCHDHKIFSSGHFSRWRYQLTSYDSKRLCEINEATFTTHNKLYAAWQAGFGTWCM